MATVRAFTITTALTQGQTITVAHGGGAAPIAAVLWAQWRQTATDGTERPGDACAGWGLVTGATSRRSANYFSGDGAVAAAQSIRDDAVLVLPYNDLNTYGRLDLQGWDATNATFVVDEVWFSQTRVVVLFIFAADVDEAAIADFTEPGATGTQDITALSGGAASLGIFIGADSTAALNTVQASYGIMFGISAGAGGEGIWLGSVEDALNNSQRSYCRGGECGAMLNRTTQTFDARFIFDSFITNGVRINWQTRTTTGRRYCALLLRGGQHVVSEFLTATTPGNNITVSSLPNTARAGLVVSANRAESAASTLSNDHECSAGAFDSLTSRAVLTGRSIGAGVTQAGQESDEVYLRLTGAGTPSVDAAADIDVIGSTSIEFDQSDGDSAQSFGWVWTLHAAAASSLRPRIFSQTAPGRRPRRKVNPPLIVRPRVTALFEHRLEGSALCTAQTSGELTTSITMAGSASCVCSASADLTTGVPMGGSASCVVTTAGALTTSIPLTGSATCIVTTTGDFTVPSTLPRRHWITRPIGIDQVIAANRRRRRRSFPGPLIARGIVEVPLASTMAGQATCTAAASGSLTTSISMSGSATCRVTGTAVLSTAIPLVPAPVTCSVTASANLTTAISMGAVVSCVVTTTGFLSTAVTELQGSVTCVVTTQAALTIGATFEGTATCAVSASAALTNAIRLAGSALLTVTASGTMADLTLPTFAVSESRSRAVAAETISRTIE